MNTASDTPDPGSASDFVAKWQARWPEWEIAQVFVPGTRRGLALAWAALQQELLDAAWAGTEPAPGEAKLLWWREEFAGWSRGARRHPLGAVLQRHEAPWMALGAALPALSASRERPADAEAAWSDVAAPARAAAGVDAALFGTGGDPAPVSATWLAARALQHGEAGVPLALLARAGQADGPAQWKSQLARDWPDVIAASRERRIWAGLARARLLAPLDRPVPSRARTLAIAWRAARN